MPSDDVEMKDKEEKDKKDVKKEEKKEEPKDPKDALVELINTDAREIYLASTADIRVAGRVVRRFVSIRPKLRSDVLRAYLQLENPVLAELLPLMDSMDDQSVDIKLSPKEAKTFCNIPEVVIYIALLFIVHLTDTSSNDTALKATQCIVKYLKTINSRMMDPFMSKAYFYLSLFHERNGTLQDIRNELLAVYRTATLRHDVNTQATILTLVMRNYIHYDLYDQALRFVRSTTFPDQNRSSEYARYLYYLGRIKAVQLEYSDAHAKLTQAIRKAPQAAEVGLGFKLQACKLEIVVELLMGEIPPRATFLVKEMKEKLVPYFEITQAVRSGDLSRFTAVMNSHQNVFEVDKNWLLIHRLRHNVIKAGLRSINVAYSRISLKDISNKLGLEGEDEAEGVAAKAIVDGVIDAVIDHEQRSLISKSNIDVYATAEPQRLLHKRIAFCLQLHNDAIKAMEYPGKLQNNQGETVEERREREAQLLEAEADDDMDIL